jgi:glycosyltransferase involved in cell wall biosynthesis
LFPQGFLNAKNLYELNKFTGAPIFWYLMDSAALTGGCHFFWDCKGYITGCGKCPGLNSINKNDQSAINFNFKKRYLDKTNIHIIAGTGRLFQQSKKSLLYKNKPIHKVLLPTDHEIFKPVQKDAIRGRLNLPKDKKIIFFGAGSLQAKRKGMKYLVEALKLIYNQQKDMDILLLVAGKHFEYIKDDLFFEYKYLGVLENNEQLASAYKVSDVFVSPSIEDAGPLMINQSIMSGTPVVSFEMGVASDLIVNGKTGYVAELQNTNDLAKGIIDIILLGKQKQQTMSKNCRKLALECLTQDVFVNKFEKILINYNLKEQ